MLLNSVSCESEIRITGNTRKSRVSSSSDSLEIVTPLKIACLRFAFRLLQTEHEFFQGGIARIGCLGQRRVCVNLNGSSVGQEF